mgnify:CR=1 FL=1
MKMTTKMIMLQNIEKMVMEQQRVDENDSYIRQDNEDLKYLEERYDQLQLSHTVKRVIDDYIACLQTGREIFRSCLCSWDKGYYKLTAGDGNAEWNCCNKWKFVKVK